ncbi:hypothetical protein JXQ31_04090 [candidate division KSB1 bacterium]|nr:hypothetical protein [candidate division KSB1 bacterium]
MKDHNQEDNINKLCLCNTHKCSCSNNKVGRCERISRITGDMKEKRFAETGYEGKKSV